MDKKISLPPPSKIQAFSYKRRRFVSLNEYLLAPVVALLQNIDKDSNQQDLSNLSYMIQQYNLLEFCILKSDFFRLVTQRCDGLETESSGSDGDEPSGKDVQIQ
ncbi:V2 [Tomato curly top virus]|nr:V2 [Tomato curly top virus]BBD96260.1 V2 [Tomato curly top virus]BBD96266.1 V2 [Tomato curly top virus]BBE00590.1 V2 [Tomato curly top virus]BBE00596.1 V2 [Tomato curly top virus]